MAWDTIFLNYGFPGILLLMIARAMYVVIPWIGREVLLPLKVRVIKYFDELDRRADENAHAVNLILARAEYVPKLAEAITVLDNKSNTLLDKQEKNRKVMVTTQKGVLLVSRALAGKCDVPDCPLRLLPSHDGETEEHT